MNCRRVKGIACEKKVKNPHIISGGKEEEKIKKSIINHVNGRVLKEAKQ